MAGIGAALGDFQVATRMGHSMESLKELLLPSNASLVLAILGGLALAIPSTRRFGRPVFVAALTLLLMLSSGWTATALLSPLEHAHPAADSRNGQTAGRAIVVLGAYGVPEPGLPISSWPNDAGLFRVVEAAHLRARCSDCRLFVTGTAPTVDAMTRVLVSLGTPEKNIEIDSNAKSTAESARNLKERLQRTPFYLVTSAGHMPRAMLAFRAMGLQPQPAPTDYRAPLSLASANPWPTPNSLMLSDLAVHEYLGILWYRLQGM